MSLLKVAGTTASSGTLYVDDVFSTYLYTGNGSTQTITNGIDLAGKGGLVWLKSRSGADPHELTNTIQGISNSLRSNSTNGASATDLTGFTSSGFTLGYVTGNVNVNGATEVSWTFRKAAKFFDVQTVTHTNGTANNIDLSVLGTVGMVIAKSTTTTGDWTVWQRTLTAGNNMQLNTTASQSTTDAWLSVSGTTATLAAAAPTDTYVIYAYAHDTSSTGIIQCGSYTGTSVVGNEINVGFEPQFIIIKRATGIAEHWQMFDNMRGIATGGNDAVLYPSLTNAEYAAANAIGLTATGFKIEGSGLNVVGDSYTYMAIRMPNKPPTSGTQVFSPLYSASPASTVQTTNFPVDMQIARYRSSGIGSFVMDRLRGVNSVVTTTVGTPYVKTNTAGSEVATTNLTNYWSNTGFSISGYLANAGSSYYNFKRAPGFFDEVCYTGSTSYRDLSHNLGAVPELVIIKTRSGGFDWTVGLQGITGTGKYLVLNSTAGVVSDINYFGSTWTSTKVLIDGNVNAINQNAYTYVMYLFATLAGISKVGSYTGNGTGQAIACGFGAAGARFVLIKRTDSTGDWYTYDSVSGLTSGSSPYVLLNSTAAEVTGNNGVYASTGGFTLGATAITTTNIATATYIFLAVA